MNLNKVSLLGNLTKDPEKRVLPSGQECSSFTVATNYQWIDYKTKEKKEQVDFHGIVTFGKLAQVANKYLTKGSKVYVEGRLHYRKWEGEDKRKRYYTEVIIDNMIMLGGGKKHEETKQSELATEDVNLDSVEVIEVN